MVLRSSQVGGSEKFVCMQLRLGGTVQDLPDSIHHHLRSIPLDEMPAALYDTADAV